MNKTLFETVEGQMGNARETGWGRVQLDDYLQQEGDARKEWEQWQKGDELQVLGCILNIWVFRFTGHIYNYTILNVPSLWNEVRPGLLLLEWENDWISLKVFREIESDWVHLEMHL